MANRIYSAVGGGKGETKRGGALGIVGDLLGGDD
jgi:hypothetical protein